MSESKHIYIVYKTTNLVNQKIYIGFHKQDFHFPVLFDGYLGSGIALKGAIEKYGPEKFTRETLFVYYTPEEAYAKEAELVNEAFVNRKDTYNICGGGMGPSCYSEEQKQKLKIANSGKNNGFFGKSHSEEQKNKWSLQRRGKPAPPRTKEHKRKLSESNKGKTHSPETKQKMSLAKIGKPGNRIGKKFTEEQLENVKKANKIIGQKRRGIKQKQITCPHCGKTGGQSTMKQWHFDNCKFNPLYDHTKKRRNSGKQKQTTCPHCGKTGGISAMTRLHMNNCKFKNNS